MKKSSEKLKFALKVIAVITAAITAFTGAFVAVGTIQNKQLNEENSITLAQMKDFLTRNSKFVAQDTIDTYKKTPTQRIVVTNNEYFNVDKNVQINSDFFPIINRNEFSDCNNYYNLTAYKDLVVYIDPNVSNEEKLIIRESISYLNNIFHSIDPSISIKEVNHLIESPTCLYIKNKTASASGDAIAETLIYDNNAPQASDAISINIFDNKLKSTYGYDADVFQAAYKSVVMHEMCHALGFPHISQIQDYNSKTGVLGISFNDLNRPLMSRFIDRIPNDFLTANEIAGMFGVINKIKYSELRSKQDKSELQAKLVADYKTYLDLIQYSLNQSRGYKLNTKCTGALLKPNQVVSLDYSDRQYNKTTNSYMNANVNLILNHPYNGYYQKEINFEDGSTKTYSAPFFLTTDGEGKYKYSLLAEDLLHFEDVNIYYKGESSKLIATDLTLETLQEKINELDQKNGYYVTENGHENKTYVYTTQNFWQKFINKYQDNEIVYESPLFTLYETISSWNIENKKGDVVIAIDTTNEFNKYQNPSNNEDEIVKE